MDFCTGRLPRDDVYCSKIPQLSNYPLDDPEPSWSWLSGVSQALNEPSVPKLYPIDGNNRLGCCVPAGGAHHLTLHNGMVGKLWVPSEADVIALYYKLGHNRDQGLPLSTMLQAMTSGVFGGQKIAADCNIDPSNILQVKKAIQYLGGVMIGFETTADTVPQFQAGHQWTKTNARTQGGHCVIVTGYSDGAAEPWEILTWGNKQTADQSWWDAYVDEVHAIVTDSVSAFDKSTTVDLINAMKSIAA